jgi:hypothetical protein
MSPVQHLKELHGLPVFDFPAPGVRQELPEAGAVAWRLAVDPYGDNSDEEFGGLWDRFTGSVDLAAVRAIVVGPWDEPCENDSGVVVRRLVDARDRLTSLRAVFIGDLEMEEAEISWIEQSDVTPVLDAYPLLEEFGIRGGTGLRFPAVRHRHLRTLRIETGGLSGEVVRGIAASELPALEHLELWLGVSNYGGDAGVADLAPVLSGGRFPALRHLGLQDSEVQDEIAAAVASAPVVAQLESLSLSMGILTDTGAAALLGGQPLTHLKQLDLRHHFLSEAMADRVMTAFGSAGTEVDLSGHRTPHRWQDEEWRYVAVSE